MPLLLPPAAPFDVEGQNEVLSEADLSLSNHFLVEVTFYYRGERGQKTMVIVAVGCVGY